MNVVRALNHRAAFSIAQRIAVPLQSRNCTAHAGEVCRQPGVVRSSRV